MATAPKPIDDESFKFKLNGAEFYCFFLLSGNPDPPIRFTGQDANEGILLTKSSIVSLDIHENFFKNISFYYITNRLFSFVS